jgi:ubiquinone/menaquinone biosynthesis C-methylase UbiE
MNNEDEKRRKGERIFWSKVARRYDGWVERAFADQYKIFKSKLISHVQPDDRILEIGTGTGEIAFYLAEKCKEVVGVDISSEMIEEAKAKKTKLNKKNITFFVEDAYHLPFPSESFDKVICVNALQTMKEPTRAIKEGKRVLKKGGEFLSITYCFGDSGFYQKLKLTKWIILYGLPKYWHNFKCKDISRLFKRLDFEIIDEQRIWKRPVVVYLRCQKELKDACLLK